MAVNNMNTNTEPKDFRHGAFRLLFAIEVFSGLSRGSYLVCIGWTTLVVTNDVSRVGHVFIVSMLTGLLAGPVIGPVVDRNNRKHLVAISHVGMALSMFFLGFVWVNAIPSNLVVLFGAVALISALRMMHNISFDGLIQSAVPKKHLQKSVARIRGVHLVFTFVGTIAAGSLIERFSVTSGFVFSAAMSVMLLIPILFVRFGQLSRTDGAFGSFLGDLKDGVGIFQSSRPIRLLAVVAATGLPVGQLSNALLSSLVRDDHGQGSEAFGIVDSAWPLGGMLAAAILALGSKYFVARGTEYVFAILAGAATLGLSLCNTVMQLFFMHCMMGLSVWICRIVVDSRILEITNQEFVGRAKVSIEMAFSISAVTMCLSPTIVKLPTTSAYFYYWGIIVMAVSILVWLSDWLGHKEESA